MLQFPATSLLAYKTNAELLFKLSLCLCFYTEQMLHDKSTKWDKSVAAVILVKVLHGEKLHFVSNSLLPCQICTTVHVQKELLLQSYEVFRLPDESLGYNLRKRGHVLDTVSCTMVSLSLMY